MNSTHAAWLNFAAAVAAAILPTLANSPIPQWVTPLVLGLNVALHAYLPDAPPGAGLTGSK